MQIALRITFTAFVVALIVLPIPPSTIIGVALATNPKTGQYMDQRVYRGVQVAMTPFGVVFGFIGKRIHRTTISLIVLRNKQCAYRIKTQNWA